jgi:hypothetical protein
MIKFSDIYKAKIRRIQALPQLYDNVMYSMNKMYATQFIENYKRGIKNEDLQLQKLSKMTMKIKADQGLNKPATPLYGKGEENKNSLINAHGIRKMKNGYKVYLRKALHHDRTNLSNKKHPITLEKLALIHENGATINVNPGTRMLLGMQAGIWLKKTTAIMRIPPRPARLKALNKVLNKRLLDKREKSLEVRKALSFYINGNTAIINRIMSQYAARGKQYESFD